MSSRIFSIPVIVAPPAAPRRSAPAAAPAPATLDHPAELSRRKTGSRFTGAADPPDISCNLVSSLHWLCQNRPKARPHQQSADSTATPAGSGAVRRGARMDVNDYSMRRLHPLLQAQLRELRARVTGGRVSAHELLEMLSRYYDTVDDERRAMVRSMQLMSDEARSLGVEIAEQGAAQLQVILDHIKDVVITANADGVIDRANPMTRTRVRLSAGGVVRAAHRRAGAGHRRSDGSIAAGLDQLAGSERHVPRHARAARRSPRAAATARCSRRKLPSAARAMAAAKCS